MEFLGSLATGILDNLLTPYTRKLLCWRVVFEDDLPPDIDHAGEGAGDAEEAGGIPPPGIAAG